MQQSGNTILITGGGTGIGRGLAEAFAKAGNQVIITGRRQAPLDEVARGTPNITAKPSDIDNPDDFQRFVAEIKAEFPKLNILINNAGIMPAEDLKAGVDNLPTAEATISTNLLGPLRLTAALMPVLLAQPEATVVTVTSGLAFVPIATNPTYCATKAAIHSWTQSLRYQLKDTKVEVLEVVPPYTQTELTGAHQAKDPNAMPLDEYLTETLELLMNSPSSGEILVKRVQPQRFAERDGKYDDLYRERNEQALARAERLKS